MSPIVQFLKVFASMLRSGRMSYSDALTRFRAQYARPAEGMEKAAIMKEVEQAPSNIVEFPKDRITDPFKPRPTEEELLEAEYRRLSSLSPEEVKVEMRKEGLTPVEERPLLKDSPEAIAKIKAENKAAVERLKPKKKTPPEDLASGGLVDLLSL